MPNEGEELTRGLPSYFPINTGSNNHKLLEPVGKAIERTDHNIESADANSNVQTADSVDSLFELAKLVDLPPRVQEPREQYRARVISEFAQNAGGGTAEDLLEIASTILNIPPETIEYSEDTATAYLNIQQNALDEIAVPVQDFVEILKNNIAAGYRIEALEFGTFTYISPDDYANDTHDAELGYDGLGDGDDPTGEGGTYAGLLG